MLSLWKNIRLGIDGKIKTINGPVVSFIFEPAPGVKVSK